MKILPVLLVQAGSPKKATNCSLRFDWDEFDRSQYRTELMTWTQSCIASRIRKTTEFRPICGLVLVDEVSTPNILLTVYTNKLCAHELEFWVPSSTRCCSNEERCSEFTRTSLLLSSLAAPLLPCLADVKTKGRWYGCSTSQT